MVQKFLKYLEFEKRYSPHTIRSYHTDLHQLKHYLNDNYDIQSIAEVNHDMLRSWVVFQIESQNSPRSIRRKISAVKSFFKWGRKYASFAHDPTLKIQLPKISRRLPVYIEEHEMEVLNAEGFFSENFEGKRDKLIVELLYQTGIRRNELITLKTLNVDIQGRTIKVLGKRNKERIIPVGEGVTALMNEYNEIRTAKNFSSPFFFITHKGKPLYPKLVYNIVKSYLSRISSLQKKSPHVLRHSFATHMLNRGADLTAIKEILGHSTLSATEVYTHNSIEKLQEIHRKAHPKG